MSLALHAVDVMCLQIPGMLCSFHAQSEQLCGCVLEALPPLVLLSRQGLLQAGCHCQVHGNAVASVFPCIVTTLMSNTALHGA